MGDIATFGWSSLTASLDPAQQHYNDLRGQFVRKADDASARFSLEYDQKIKNLDNLIEKVSGLAVPHILEAVEDAVKALVSHKIFDVDSEHFIQKFYQPYDCWSKAFEAISDKYAEIVHSAEELDAYRTARRQGRGQIIGGGFGVEGVAKGMAVAGAANLAMGAAHGVFNLAAKGISAIGDATNKGSIFAKPETKDDLVNAVFLSILSVHYALLDALRASSCELAFRGVTEEEEGKALRMLNNLKEGRLGEVDKVAILRDILILNPYLESAYIYAVDTFGDADAGLERTARFFHVNLCAWKKKQLRSMINVKTENDAKVSLEKIQDAGLRLGYPVDQDLVPELKQTLQKFDTDARTFEGKIYPTRQAAAAAAAKFKQERQEKRDATVQSVKRGIKKIVKWVAYTFAALIVFVIALFVIGALIHKPPTISPQEVAAASEPVQPTQSEPAAPDPALPPIPSESLSALPITPSGVVSQILSYAQKNDEEAISKMIDLVEAEPKPVLGDRKLARQFNEQGLAALKTGEHALAISLFLQGTKADPSDEEVLNNLGCAYLEIGNLPEAQNSLNATLMLAPRRSSAWENLATLFARTGQQQQGVAARLMANRFSQNPQKTVEFMQKASTETTSNSLK